MTEDGGPDDLSFASVAIVRGKAEVWTMGMHVLGLRDIVMKRADVEMILLDTDYLNFLPLLRVVTLTE